MPGTPYQRAHAHWTWQPAYRADLQAFAEVLAGTWSLRLEAGVGRRLNQPDCAFVGDPLDVRASAVSSTCSEAPTAYQWDKTPDQNLRPVSFVLEHRFDFSQPALAASASPGYRSPETAYRLSLYSTILPVLGGAMLLGASANTHNDDGLIGLGVAAVVLGTTFGPSIGYLYAGDNGRAWGYGILRLAGVGLFVVGSANYLADNMCEYCHGSRSSTALAVLGIGTLLATVASSIHDITSAPQAARRENERRGITALSIVPIVNPGDAQAPKGVALAGAF